VPSQEEVDKYFKLYKETGEKLETIVDKLDKTAGEKVELVSKVKEQDEKIKKLEEEKKVKPAYVPPAGDEDLTKVYTLDNPPQTQEEWNDLYDSNPSAAHDLKNQVTKVTSEHSGKMKNAAKTVQDKHPDMYKLKEDGTIKRFKADAQGNYAKDNTGAFIEDTAGLPMLDEESEKGKIWIGIATDANFLRSPNAPVIIMEAMENKLKTKKEKDMADKLKKDKEDKEIKRTDKVDKVKLAAGGDNPPPPPEDDVEIKYGSEEEKKHVHAAIAAGRYKDEKDYFRAAKKGSVISYGRGGF